MSPIWWSLTAFFGGAVAAILVFASIILLFALTKVALGKLKRTLRTASTAGVDPHIDAGGAYKHPYLHPVASQ